MNRLYNNTEGLFLRLIPKKEGLSLAEDYPFDPFLNLAVGYRWLKRMDDGTRISVPVKYSDLEMYKIGRDQLFELAAENTKRLFKAQLFRIEEIIDQIVSGTKARNIMDDNTVLSKNCMYVLTNESGAFGAATMLDFETLAEISERIAGNFFILPSSIHELIIMPETEDLDKAELRAVVNEVNRTAVSVCDFLSDSVYMFNAKEKSVVCVA